MALLAKLFRYYLYVKKVFMKVNHDFIKFQMLQRHALIRSLNT